MKKVFLHFFALFGLAFGAFSMMSAPAMATGYGIGSDGYWYNDNATNGTSITTLSVSMSNQTGTFVAMLSGDVVCPCGPLYIVFDGTVVGNTEFGILKDSTLTVVLTNLDTGSHSIYAEFRPYGPNQTSHSPTYTVTITADGTPTVTAISPASGSTDGGTSVTITGTEFTGTTDVTIGGTAVTSYTVVSDTQITAVTPAGSSGQASVLVTNATGTNSANTLFRYSSGSGGNPKSDAVVVGIVTSHVAMAANARQQITSIVQNRLELLHGDDAPAFSNGISLNVIDRNAGADAARNGLKPESNNGQGGFGNGEPFADPTLNEMAKKAAAKKGVANPKFAKPDYRVWTEGALVSGTQSTSGQSDNSFRTSGLSAGIDTQILDSVKGGFAVSLSMDKTKFGTDGSYSDGTSVTGSLYASWRVDKDIFIDAFMGYGKLDYAINRYDSNSDSDMTADRTGRMFFGSLTASYDQKNGALKYAPFVGFDVMSGTLNAYTETGDATYNLGYDSLSIRTEGLIAGFRAQYDVPMPWGTLSPTGRVQYRHALAADMTQTLYYDSDPSTTYDYALSGFTVDTVTTSLGLKATGPTGISTMIEYSNYSSLNGDQANGVRGMISIPF
jgi:uncharacterized protein YhjY with autotransporter beta-barrel domain